MKLEVTDPRAPPAPFSPHGQGQADTKCGQPERRNYMSTRPGPRTFAPLSAPAHKYLWRGYSVTSGLLVVPLAVRPRSRSRGTRCHTATSDGRPLIPRHRTIRPSCTQMTSLLEGCLIWRSLRLPRENRASASNRPRWPRSGPSACHRVHRFGGSWGERML
jgi:hypothetical protein